MWRIRKRLPNVKGFFTGVEEGRIHNMGGGKTRKKSALRATGIHSWVQWAHAKIQGHTLGFMGHTLRYTWGTPWDAEGTPWVEESTCYRCRGHNFNAGTHPRVHEVQHQGGGKYLAQGTFNIAGGCEGIVHSKYTFEVHKHHLTLLTHTSANIFEYVALVLCACLYKMN